MPRVLNIRNLPNHRIPESAVYVGRANKALGLDGSKWRNPFKMTAVLGTPTERRAYVIEMYRNHIIAEIQNGGLDISELRGRDLVCWCSPLPCHGDVLLALANQEVSR